MWGDACVLDVGTHGTDAACIADRQDGDDEPAAVDTMPTVPVGVHVRWRIHSGAKIAAAANVSAPGRMAGMNRRASQKCSGEMRIL